MRVSGWMYAPHVYVNKRVYFKRVKCVIDLIDNKRCKGTFGQRSRGVGNLTSANQATRQYGRELDMTF